MSSTSNERLSRQPGKSMGEARGREDTPAPKRRRDMNTVEDSVTEPECREEDRQEGVAENKRLIHALMGQMADLTKTVMGGPSEKEGM